MKSKTPNPRKRLNPAQARRAQKRRLAYLRQYARELRALWRTFPRQDRISPQISVN